MDIICASSGLVWPKKPKKGISGIKEGGFEEIMLDLSACCSTGELEYLGKEIIDSKFVMNQQPKEIIRISEHPEELCSSLKLLLDECKKESVRISIARAPYLKRDTKREDLGDLLERLAEESIKVCGQAGCRYLIVKPLFSRIERGHEWEINRKYYLSLADIAKQNNVMILLENQSRD